MIVLPLPRRTEWEQQNSEIQEGFTHFLAELHQLEEKLPDFRYIPALSEADVDDDWDGETGFVTDVVKRHAADLTLTEAHAYVCGPPPMVEAALPLLAQLGVEEKRIYYDKFTTTGDPGQQ